ncbi:MAG TPA: hypothetical protein PKD55_20250 [Bellilinea sp.]|nr:hypothetical protein [Bellilinea sp.]
MLNLLSALASVATAVAVIVAAWQLVLSKRQAMTAFEDSLAKEYRDLAAKIPVKALLGDPLSEAECAQHFDELYHYFDLCNEQIFLVRSGRISRKTWAFWQDGIASNMARPAFSRAWSEIAARAGGDFSELRDLFPPDPFDPPVA